MRGGKRHLSLSTRVHPRPPHVPQAIDILERKQLQLEVEQTALETELARDPSAKLRLEKCKEALAECREELRPLKLRHLEEKEHVNAIRECQKKIEEVGVKLAQAQRARDTAKVADLQVREGCIRMLRVRRYTERC